MVALPFNIGINISSAAYTMAFWALGFILVATILGWVIYKWYDKKTYIHPVWLWDFKSSGQPEIKMDFKGGVIKNKAGNKDFKIKHKKYFWQNAIMGYQVDLSVTNSKNILHFIKVGNEYQQLSFSLAYAKTGEGGEQVVLLAEPIPVDLKNAVAVRMTMAKNLFNKEKLTAYAIGVIAFVIMAVVQIAFLYFTRKR